MKKFSYNDNGMFRICQLTDIHLDTTDRLNEYEKTFNLIRKAIADTKPDLVVITGDIAWGQGSEKAVNELCELFDELKMPWAPVLGNHDGEARDGEIKTREDFAKLLLNREYCFFEKGEDGVQGNGNYILKVENENEICEWVLFMLDSHQGDIFPSQIDWYRNKSREFSKEHQELSFFHVPIPEYSEVWNYEECKGNKAEDVCSTRYNDGLFSAFVREGKMQGVFVGHDHINDYEGTLNGIRLCYGRGSGYQCYGMENFPLGARLIDLKQGSKSFDTYIYIEESGLIYKQTTLHKPEFCKK